MAGEELKAGLIGCGSLGRVHCEAVGEVGGLRMTGFADAMDGRAEE